MMSYIEVPQAAHYKANRKHIMIWVNLYLMAEYANLLSQIQFFNQTNALPFYPSKCFVFIFLEEYFIVVWQASLLVMCLSGQYVADCNNMQ